MKKMTMLWASVCFGLTGCPNSSCVARGARISTPEGLRPIEDLRVGDKVYAVNTETGERVTTAITFIKSATREVGSVSLNGVKTRMTSDHPVYDPETQSYHPAGDWFLGTRTTLLAADGESFTNAVPEAVSTFDGVEEVFDISVDSEFHNFIADGIVVHNKDVARTCELPTGEVVSEFNQCEVEACEVGRYECSDQIARCVCEFVGDADTGTDVSNADSDSSDVGEDVGADGGDVGSD